MSEHNGLRRSILYSFLSEFCWLGSQRVAPFYRQHWLTQALERFHFQFDPLFLESHCHLNVAVGDEDELEEDVE